VKDLVGGQIDLIVAQIPAVKGLIDAGKLRALAVASPTRSAALPNVPTVDEAAGLKGFSAVSWYAIVGPAGMDKTVVEKINADMVKVIRSPAGRERLQALGADAVGSTQAELLQAMRADSERYGSIINRLGIKAD
jgi:tripartite-type tricarboxylate transporter receptor subunit TctC